MAGDDLHKELEMVEEISAALVLVDPSDNQALAVNIHGKFQELHDCTEDPNVQAAAKNCIGLVEKIIFQEIKADEAINQMSEVLTGLRRTFLYGAEGLGDNYEEDLENLRKESEGQPVEIHMDDEEEAAAAAPALEIVQDEDGFFVDKNAPAKSAESSFARQIDINTLDTSLLGEFIAESEEHILNADDALLRLETDPANVEIINELFRVFHTIKGVAGFLSLGAVQTLTHATESLMDKAREKAFVLTAPAIDLVFTTVDTLKKEIESLKNALESGGVYVVQDIMDQLIASVNAMLDNLMSGGDGEIASADGAAAAPKLGEILLSEGKVSEPELVSALEEQERKPDAKLGEILVDRGVIAPADVAVALDKQGVTPASGKAAVVKESVKVDTDKLDRLVDMIGELVITEAMVTGELEGGEFQTSKLGVNARQLRKITRQLQEVGMSMRMMSLKATFQKMARLIRDLAKKAGKEINFVSIGEDTELDRSVIEHISDPLVHMLRNSADHGLEPPEDRVAAGKPREGTVTLKAYQKGGNICIEIQDDGRGLNRDAILKKAIEKGVIEPNAQISDNEINHLIFAPGFSTAAQVTDISGRGVGMDVVKRNVEALRGRIEINTKLGVGTTFVINLPLTLAIMDGMVVVAGGDRYVVPTLSVVENFRPSLSDLTNVMGTQKMVMCHGELIRLYSLAEVMGKKNTVSIEDGIVMVVEDAGKRTGLLVDQIIGQQQTVIKKLGDGLGKIQGISGGAIMSDGQVSLIVDVAETVKMSASCGSMVTAPEEKPAKPKPEPSADTDFDM